MPKLPSRDTFFKDPIVESGADPYVAKDEQYFYYCYVVESDKTEIFINRADKLEDIGKARPVKVWAGTKSPKPFLRNIWAPELHHLDGKWYIYFAADNTPDNPGPSFPYQRMYVLESDNVLGPYHMVGKIADRKDRWAIDATILEHPNGSRYFVWSGWSDLRGEEQQLYIARMLNPWTLEGNGVMISKPEYEWEKRGLAVNEGPQVLRRDNHINIIYSASWSITDDYCLGQLTLKGDDPLDPSNWVKHPQPIFEKTKKLAGTGHACFLLSDDGQYGWMVFHAAKHPGAGWDRQVRLAAFTWGEDGLLRFIQVGQHGHREAEQELAKVLKISQQSPL